MATYKEIVGQKITKVTSDPSEPKTGQMWYNSTTGSLRGLSVLSAWSSGGPLITARNSLGSFGTQTASVGVAGNTTTAVANTEEYNGSGWSNGTNYPASLRWPEGTGTLTAGIVAGGGPSRVTTVNKYDGTSWTSANGIPTATNAGAMFGVQASCVYALGYTGSNTGASYEFDGTNWTNGGTANTARRELAGSGTLTAGLVFGGSPATAATEEYDGTSWTASGNLGTARYGLAGSNAGTQDSSLAFSGGNPAITTNERYNGSTWSTDTAVSTAARFLGGTGTANSALKFGGYTGSAQTGSTEEYNKSANVITGATWSTKTNAPPIAREQGTGFGQTTNAYIHGGYFSNPTSTQSGKYFEYNGTSHNAIPNTSKTIGWRSGSGSSTSGLVVGGYFYPGGSGPYANAESYNGSSWSNETAAPFAEYGFVATGATETATLMIAGDEGPTATLEYDGSSWTTSGVYPFGGYQQQMGGTQTAAVAGGGITVPGGAPSIKSDAYEYNGSSWTATGSFLQTTKLGSISGPQTAALQFGGDSNPSPSTVSYSQSYDGSVFGTAAAMGTRRKNNNSGSGTGSSTVTAGGNTGGGAYPLGTEEFSSATESLNKKNLSTS